MVVVAVIGVLVIVGLVYGAISTYQAQQVGLRAKAQERRDAGLEGSDRAEHARREAEARRLDDQ